MKRIALSVIVVFVLWSVLDYLIHGVLLLGVYDATSELWRPQGEAKMGLNSVVVLVFSFVFVYLYVQYVKEKSMAVALQYGLLLGIGMGVVHGFGMYAFMPMPYSLALAWCLALVVEMTAAGAVVGWLRPGSSG